VVWRVAVGVRVAVVGEEVGAGSLGEEERDSLRGWGCCSLD
jgi:hypothetical protein